MRQQKVAEEQQKRVNVVERLREEAKARRARQKSKISKHSSALPLREYPRSLSCRWVRRRILPVPFSSTQGRGSYRYGREEERG